MDQALTPLSREQKRRAVQVVLQKVPDRAAQSEILAALDLEECE